jgi:hypothetical protein
VNSVIRSGWRRQGGGAARQLKVVGRLQAKARPAEEFQPKRDLEDSKV